MASDRQRDLERELEAAHDFRDQVTRKVQTQARELQEQAKNILALERYFFFFFF